MDYIAKEKFDFGILTIIYLKEKLSYPMYFRQNNYQPDHLNHCQKSCVFLSELHFAMKVNAMFTTFPMKFDVMFGARLWGCGADFLQKKA